MAATSGGQTSAGALGSGQERQQTEMEDGSGDWRLDATARNRQRREQKEQERRMEMERKKEEHEKWNEVRRQKIDKRLNEHEREAERMGLEPKEYKDMREVIMARQEARATWPPCGRRPNCPVTAKHRTGECTEGRCVFCGQRGHIEQLCPHKRLWRGGTQTPPGEMQVKTNQKILIPVKAWDGINNRIFAEDDERKKETLKAFAAEVENTFECDITFRTTDEDWKGNLNTIKEIMRHQGMEDCKPTGIQATIDKKKWRVTFGTKEEQERMETETSFHVDQTRAEVAHIRAKGKKTTKVQVRGFPLGRPVIALKNVLNYFGTIEGEIMENNYEWDGVNGGMAKDTIRDGVYTLEMKLKHHIPRRMQLCGEPVTFYYNSQVDCECKMPASECGYIERPNMRERHEELLKSTTQARTRIMMQIRGIPEEVMGGNEGGINGTEEGEDMKELEESDIMTLRTQKVQCPALDPSLKLRGLQIRMPECEIRKNKKQEEKARRTVKGILQWGKEEDKEETRKGSNEEIMAEWEEMNELKIEVILIRGQKRKGNEIKDSNTTLIKVTARDEIGLEQMYNLCARGLVKAEEMSMIPLTESRTTTTPVKEDRAKTPFEILKMIAEEEDESEEEEEDNDNKDKEEQEENTIMAVEASVDTEGGNRSEERVITINGEEWTMGQIQERQEQQLREREERANRERENRERERREQEEKERQERETREAERREKEEMERNEREMREEEERRKEQEAREEEEKRKEQEGQTEAMMIGAVTEEGQIQETKKNKGEESEQKGREGGEPDEIQGMELGDKSDNLTKKANGEEAEGLEQNGESEGKGEEKTNKNNEEDEVTDAGTSAGEMDASESNCEGGTDDATEAQGAIGPKPYFSATKIPGATRSGIPGPLNVVSRIAKDIITDTDEEPGEKTGEGKGAKKGKRKRQTLSGKKEGEKEKEGEKVDTSVQKPNQKKLMTELDLEKKKEQQTRLAQMKALETGVGMLSATESDTESRARAVMLKDGNNISEAEAQMNRRLSNVMKDGLIKKLKTRLDNKELKCIADAAHNNDTQVKFYMGGRKTQKRMVKYAWKEGNDKMKYKWEEDMSENPGKIIKDNEATRKRLGGAAIRWIGKLQLIKGEMLAIDKGYSEQQMLKDMRIE